ncbi:hypothetical protein BSKO_07056 [Bryopsis sp. KO-2023]|nr:hypothetical protein BSKO_07056 [Bryopsis sp. KO-2023]
MDRESENLLLGRYEFLRELGKGSLGSVYLAEDHKTGDLVAIKVLPLDRATRRAIYKIRYRHLLKHRNIIRLREVLVKEGPTPTGGNDHERSGDLAYLVLDFASRGTLRQEICRKNGILSEEDARALFGQLMSAVAYCHQRGEISRDITLSNVLLDDPKPSTDGDAVVKLCGFGGLFNLATGGGRSMAGYVDYIAPEALTRHVQFTHKKQDIWSCGVVLYMMVTGLKPFSGIPIAATCGQIEALIKAVVHGAYAYPEHREVSKECEDLISRCLVKNPQERLDAEQVLAHPWLQHE